MFFSEEDAGFMRLREFCNYLKLYNKCKEKKIREVLMEDAEGESGSNEG